MNVEKVEQIRDLIIKDEIEKAKAEGVLENIKKQCLADYGTDDLNELEKICADKKSELEKSEKRREKLYNELVESYDWDSLSNEE